MRVHGTLTKWNDDRGFGFVAPSQNGSEIFVHISEFPGDGQRPRLNEIISFEVSKGPDGRPRAVRVMRPGQPSARRLPGRATRPPRPLRLWPAIMVFAALAAMGIYGFSGIHGSTRPAGIAAGAAAAQPTAPSPYRCDGRTTCSQMTSCAEAKYFLQHCPNVTMDGDGDGKPCEQQWCN